MKFCLRLRAYVIRGAERGKETDKFRRFSAKESLVRLGTTIVHTSHLIARSKVIQPDSFHQTTLGDTFYHLALGSLLIPWKKELYVQLKKKMLRLINTNVKT